MFVKLRVGIEEPISWNQPTTKISFPQNRAFPSVLGGISQPCAPSDGQLCPLQWPTSSQPHAPSEGQQRRPPLPPFADGYAAPLLPPSLHWEGGGGAPLSPSGRGCPSSPVSLLRQATSPLSYLSPPTRRRTGSKSTTGKSSGVGSSSTTRRTSAARLHLSLRRRAARRPSPAPFMMSPAPLLNW